MGALFAIGFAGTVFTLLMIAVFLPEYIDDFRQRRRDKHKVAEIMQQLRATPLNQPGKALKIASQMPISGVDSKFKKELEKRLK